ncbi:hypothetical protein HRbin23_00328 [bacterium HR23]|nr:hypothetical protein HRbin23_00328 [bacterium HR23]
MAQGNARLTLTLPGKVLALPLVGSLWRYRGWAVAAGLCGGVLALRFVYTMSRGGPPGPDPGDWLALGHDLFGERVRAARAVFPPLVPALAKGFALLLGPLPGLALLGALALVAAAPAVFFMAYHSGGLLWAGVATLGALFLPYHNEAMAWGGYPQLLAEALVLASLVLLGRGLQTGHQRLFLVSAGAGVLGIATSVWGVAFLALSVPLLLATALLVGLLRPATLRLLGAWWLPPVVVGGVLLTPIYWGYFSHFAEVPLNPSRLAPPDAFRFVFREWPWGSGSIFFVLPFSAGLAVYCLWLAPRPNLLGLTVPPLILTALAFYFPTGEPRFLSLLELGIWLGICAVLVEAWAAAQRLAPKGQVGVRWGLLGVALALTAFVVARGNQRAVASDEWYRVVTPEVHQALEWLRRHGIPGSVVVASGNLRGFQYFWWIEGYARLPAFSATDPKWMALKDEVWQNAVARQVLASPSPQEVASLAQEHHIRYLFLDKRVVKETEVFRQAGFVPAFENATILVLQWGGFTAPGPAPPPVPPGA